MVTAAAPASMTFRIAPGARLRKGDADVLGREFMRLRKSGPLTTERLVLEASRRGSPLRRFFEWDNRKAAQEYRFQQAAYLLRNVEVVIEDAKGKEVAIKGFYNVTSVEGGRRWEPMQFAFEDVELAEQIVADAHSQLEGWITRFERYQWARSAVPLARRALKQIKIKRKRSGSNRVG